MTPINEQFTTKKSPDMIVPFEIEQAIVGMEMGPLDDAVLAYLRFFSNLIRFKAINCLHALPKFNWKKTFSEQISWSSEDDCLVDELMTAEMKTRVVQCFAEDRMRVVMAKVCQGSPLAVLLREAEATQADLVVIGQKHETTSKGILAKNLVRKTKCNALVIPKAAKHSLSRILVPVDFSEHSQKALKTAIAFRQQIPTVEIVAVHVYELPNFSRVNKAKLDVDLSIILEQDRKSAFNAFLQTYAPENWEQIKPILVRKNTLPVAYSIRNYALENQVDFVIMGAKGHSEVELLMLGSVTEEFMSINKEIPTLIIKCCRK